jgi:hypothetical protein
MGGVAGLIAHLFRSRDQIRYFGRRVVRRDAPTLVTEQVLTIFTGLTGTSIDLLDDRRVNRQVV